MASGHPLPSPTAPHCKLPHGFFIHSSLRQLHHVGEVITTEGRVEMRGIRFLKRWHKCIWLKSGNFFFFSNNKQSKPIFDSDRSVSSFILQGWMSVGCVGFIIIVQDRWGSVVITGLTVTVLPGVSPVGSGEGTHRGVPKQTCRASELGWATLKEPKHAIRAVRRDKQGYSPSRRSN